MNSFLLLPRVVLIITVSAQCVLILLLWRPIAKKKRIFKLEGLVLVSVISLYEANRVGAQCLRSWGRRASSHLRKGRPIIFGTVSETMDPQKVNIKKYSSFISEAEWYKSLLSERLFGLFWCPWAESIVFLCGCSWKKRNDILGDGGLGAWWVCGKWDDGMWMQQKQIWS